VAPIIESKRGDKATETNAKKGNEHMSKRTYEQTAESYELWCDYVDPNATMTEEEFNELSTEEKIKMQEDMFGKEDGIEDEHE